MTEKLRPCFPMREDRDKTTLVSYLQEDLETRAVGVDAALNYLSEQTPNKNGTIPIMFLILAIGIVGGFILARLIVPS